MSSAWLRTPRLFEPEDFREHETQHERYDASRELLDRFGEFTPPRPTVRETCRGCDGAGSAGKFECPVCHGKGYRNRFVDRPGASRPPRAFPPRLAPNAVPHEEGGFRQRPRSGSAR